LVLAGCALAGALGLSGCGGAPTGGGTAGTTAALAADTPVTKGIIQDDKGTPLAGAKIEAHPANGGKTVVSATSAADGTFDLAAPTCTYNILVTPQTGLAPQKFLGHTITAGSHLDVILIDGRQRMLAGHVTDQNGQAIPNVSVCTQPDPQGGCATTDAAGAFVLFSMVGETLIVSGTLPDGTQFNGSLTVERFMNPKLEIVVPESILTGTVVDQAGRPVPGAIVDLPSCSFPSSTSLGPLTGSVCSPATQTDRAGRFRLGVAPGTVRLQISNPTRASTDTFFVEETVAGDTDVTIQVPPIARLSGRIADHLGNGFAQQTVCLSFDSCVDPFCQGRCVATDGDGRYQQDLFPGTFTMRVSGFGLGARFGLYSLSKTITVSGPTQQDITLPDVVLTGTVLDLAGVPAPNVSLQSSCVTANVDGFVGISCANPTVTDQGGRFQFPYAVGGSDVFIVGAALASPAINLSNDVDVVIQLQNPPELTGQVLAEDGSGLAGASVCFSPQSAGSSGCAETGADGRYQLTLLPGSYLVSATASIGSDVVSFFEGGAVTVPSVAAPIRLPRPRLVSGQMFESDGRPLPGVFVTPAHGCSSAQVAGGFEGICSDSDTPETDEAGRFEFPAVVGPSLFMRGNDEDFFFTMSGVPIVDDTDLLIGIESGLLPTGPQPPPKN
jgi:protocatechuate 3,4-dioxygenase beta subunit